MNLKVKEKISGMTGQYRITRYKSGTNEVIHKSDWIKNLVVSNDTNGVNLVARQLAGDNTYNPEITGCKMGTGTTPASISDTDLETDVTGFVARQLISNTVSGVFIQFFITDAELPNASYSEFGLFCGSQMFTRSIISPAYSKTGAEDIKVDYQININTI